MSRRRAVVVVTVILNTGAVMQTAADPYAALVAGRTVGGIGVGTLATPATFRPKSLVMSGIFNASQLVAAAIRLVVPVGYLWRTRRWDRLGYDGCHCWSILPRLAWTS
ncbi:Sugar (and other) transporter [Geosmithia morbida]|uniref:Sugar (And other) transporter n=1 Tax=Geosmithia morbida TaxID=1094350 RepID=A0A9P4YPT5_9HYPO|nr:Sugar (and other) transporter [Geosmithia morbida]KAF4119587.1 Sugar (and other) transporter [Geosmithia morbida]